MQIQVDKWDTETLDIPIDKTRSNYASDKEKNFPRNATVLDLGGGVGADSLYFASQGHAVTLADISHLALTRAAEKASKERLTISTVWMDFSKGKLPFKDNLFDIVYSRLALHYFDPQTTTRLFKEIYRVLAANGQAFATLKSPDDKNEMKFLSKTARPIGENIFEDNGFIKSRYMKKQLEEFLLKAGIPGYKVESFSENLSGRVDKIKSSSSIFILNEVILKKHKLLQNSNTL